MRTPVDGIPNSEEAVAARVELELPDGAGLIPDSCHVVDA